MEIFRFHSLLSVILFNPCFRVLIKIIEKIGTYNPMTEPSTIVLDKEKVEKWIKNGAKPTDTVKALIEKAK